jgi:hypothetical protein
LPQSLLAVAAGVLGYLAARTRNKHERLEAQRDRQYQASSEFAAAVGEALPRVRDATYGDPATARSLVHAIDVAHGLESRIEILFGPTSTTTQYARSTLVHLRDAAVGIQAVPPDSTRARTSMLEADDDLRRFAAHAHAVITKTKPDPPTHLSTP